MIKLILVLLITLFCLFSLIIIISLYFTFILIASKKYTTKFTIEDGIKKSEFTENEVNLDKKEYSFTSRFGYKLNGHIIIRDINKIVFFSHGVTWTLYGMYKYVIPFLERGYTCVLIDSKGHGSSSGGFPSYGFFEKYDLYDCYHYVLSLLKSNYYNFNPIIGFFGESMGAAITLQTLSLFLKDDSINFCIVESPFSDLEKLCKIKLENFLKIKPLANIVLKISRVFIKLFAGFDINAIKPINDALNSNVPILLFHGKMDNLIPYAMSKEIYDKRKDIFYTEFYLIENADHTKGFVKEKNFYIEKIFNFIDNVENKYK